ncbi:MAG: 3-dehydroquinate synthase [Candidatus Dormibacteria bacterium]
MPELRVNAASGGYPVIVEPGASAAVGAWVRDRAAGSKVLVVCDHNTAEVAGTRIAEDAGAEVLELEPGEPTKTFSNVGAICVSAAAAGLDRRSIIVAVGGGVVGDVAGTAAAVYLRGIRLVQVPTTLLAMVDSSIGGKVGVNLSAGKNLVGAFKSPEGVFVDPDLLERLPEREYRSGMAEVIKSGFIADAELSRILQERGDAVRRRRPEALLDVITRTCAVKVGVVSRDETESGERMILNFGHTFAHALEAASTYSRDITHGEAVSIGMEVAAKAGVDAGVTPIEVYEAVQRQLDAYGLPRRSPLAVAPEDILRAMSHDKKSHAGRVRWVLLESLGRATWGHELDDAAVREAIAWGLRT